MKHKPIIFLLLALVISACNEKAAETKTTEVIVDNVVARDYNPSNMLIGRLKANDDAEIKANVTGYLKDRFFREGDFVEKGTRLFLIDPAPYKAELAKAKAELANAKAANEVAILNFNRGQELRPKGAISASEMDKLTSAKLQAAADMEAAQAKLVKAEVNLAYTEIKAPFSGQIGRSEYSNGDLVNPQSKPLTTLVDADPIKVIFQVSEAVYLNFAKRRAELEAAGQQPEDFNVSLQLANGETYPHIGKIDYIANRVSEETGTIEGRAIIANPNGLLKPGQYARVRFESTLPVQALFVPQTAVQADQQGSFVLTVTPSQQVERRNVLLGERIAENVVVQQGLTGNEQVIVRGLQLVRPGQTVSTKHIGQATASQASKP